MARGNQAQVEEMAESYLNGNISDFKNWIKKTNKINIVLTIALFNNIGKDGIDIVYRYLTT